MKSFIAYALLVIGLPQAAGLLVGLPFAMLAGRLAPPGGMYRRFALIADPFNGLGAVIASVLLFRLLEVELTWVLPLVLVLRSAVYFLPKEQFLMWVCYSGGILGGWAAWRSFLA